MLFGLVTQVRKVRLAQLDAAIAPLAERQVFLHRCHLPIVRPLRRASLTSNLSQYAASTKRGVSRLFSRRSRRLRKHCYLKIAGLGELRRVWDPQEQDGTIPGRGCLRVRDLLMGEIPQAFTQLRRS